MGLIARAIEQAGIPTVYLGSCRDIMAQVRAPRSVFLDYPLGRQCGRPGDREEQTRILRGTLTVLETAGAPGTLADLPYSWPRRFDWQSYWKDVEDMLHEEGQTKQEWTGKS